MERPAYTDLYYTVATNHWLISRSLNHPLNLSQDRVHPLATIVGPQFTGVAINRCPTAVPGQIKREIKRDHRCHAKKQIQQEPTDTSKQPIRTRYLGHVTGYQPIRTAVFPGSVDSWYSAMEFLL